MKTPSRPYSDAEWAAIEASTKRAMETLAVDGGHLPFSTHMELAEFAFILNEVRELEKRLLQIIGEDSTCKEQ